MHLKVQPGVDILETHMALSIAPGGGWWHLNTDFLVWVPMQCPPVWAHMHAQTAMQRSAMPGVAQAAMQRPAMHHVAMQCHVVWLPMQRVAKDQAHLGAISPMCSALLASWWLCLHLGKHYGKPCAAKRQKGFYDCCFHFKKALVLVTRCVAGTLQTPQTRRGLSRVPR